MNRIFQIIVALLIVLLLSGIGSAADIQTSGLPQDDDLKNTFKVQGHDGDNIRVTHFQGGYLFYSVGAHPENITVSVPPGKLRKIEGVMHVVHVDEQGKSKIVFVIPEFKAGMLDFPMQFTSNCIDCFTGMQNQSFAKLNNSTVAIVANPLPSSNISSLTLKNITRLDGNGTFQVKTNANGTYSSVWTSGDLSIPFLSTEGNILNLSFLFNNTDTNISCILQAGYTQNSTDISETSVDGFHYTNTSILFDANFTNGTITHTIGDATFLANSRTESVSLNTTLPNATVTRTATQYITTFTGTVSNTTTYYINITDGYASYSNTSWANVTLDNVSVDQCTNGLSPSPSITTGLVSYWTANGCAKDWNRTSANDGTLYGGMGYNASGKDGAAWELDGGNDYVDMGTSNTLFQNNSYSMAAWVKPNNISSVGTIVSRMNGTGAVSTGVMFRITNYFGIYHNDSTGWKIANTPSVIQNNTWYNVVGVYNGTHIITYLDGVFSSSTAVAGFAVSPLVQTTKIGRYSYTSAIFFNGSIDEVRIYNRALSNDEINTSYNASRVKYGTIITNTTFASGQQGWYSNSIVNNLSTLSNYSVYSSTDNSSYGIDQLLAANNTNYSITQKANNQFLKLILQGNGTNAPIVQSITLHSTASSGTTGALPNWAVGLGLATAISGAIYGVMRRRTRTNQMIIYSLYRGRDKW